MNEVWTEPSVFWGGVVGGVGDGKVAGPGSRIETPVEVTAGAVRPAVAWIGGNLRADLAFHACAMKDWSKNGHKKGEPPPQKPRPATIGRMICSDTTIEALAVLLDENPRGVTTVVDELATSFGNMNRYNAGKDLERWLSMHRANEIMADRKSTEKRTIFVPHAAVSLIGGMTPGGFRKQMGDSNLDNGLAARLLVLEPPRRPKRWRDSELPHELTSAVERLYRRLLALDMAVDDGEPMPVDVGI